MLSERTLISLAVLVVVPLGQATLAGIVSSLAPVISLRKTHRVSMECYRRIALGDWRTERKSRGKEEKEIKEEKEGKLYDRSLLFLFRLFSFFLLPTRD